MELYESKNWSWYSLFVLLWLAIYPEAQAQSVNDSIPLSLNEAWNRTNANSKVLKLKYLDTKKAQEEIKDAKQSKLPEIGVEGSYGKLANIPVFTEGILEEPEYIPLEDRSVYDAGIEAYFNIYNGNLTKNHIAKAETQQELLQYLEKESISAIHYKVASYYLNLQRYIAFKKLIVQNIKQNEKQLDRISKLYNNGVVLKSDLLRAKLQLSRQQTNLQEMKNNVALSMQALNILMGYEDTQLLKPTDVIATDLQASAKTYDSYLTEGIASSPEEMMAKKKIELAKLNKNMLKASKSPKIGLFGSYTYSFPQIMLYPYETAPYLMGVAGIKISYNISALYHDKHKELAADIAMEKQELERLHTEDELRKGINTAYMRFHEDLDKIDVSRMNIEQASENYRIVYETYFNQLALITDLLDADTQLLQAKFELINSQISARLHYYQLLKITGEL